MMKACFLRVIMYRLPDELGDICDVRACTKGDEGTLSLEPSVEAFA